MPANCVLFIRTLLFPSLMITTNPSTQNQVDPPPRFMAEASLLGLDWIGWSPTSVALLGAIYCHVLLVHSFI